MEKSEKSVQHTQTQQPIDKNCLSDLSLGGLSTIFLIILERNHSQNFDKKGHQLLMKYLPLLTREKTHHIQFSISRIPPYHPYHPESSWTSCWWGFSVDPPRPSDLSCVIDVSLGGRNSNCGRWMGPFSKLRRIQVPHNYFFAIYKRRPKRRFVTPRIGGLVRGIPSKMPKQFRFRNCSVENGIMFEREVTTGGTSFFS